MFYGYSPVNPVDVIGKVNCPILLIHEADDNLVTLSETQQLLNAANQPASLWQVAGAAHSQAYDLAPSVYIARLSSFFQQYLG